MPESFEGKVALVTGHGSSGSGWGNGRATATLLARRGAKIVGIDKDEKAGEATREIIESEGGTCLSTVGDVTVDGTGSEAVGLCLERWGRIDVLVNNVGQSIPGGPVEIGPEDWQSQFDLNLNGAYLTTRAALPAMEEAGSGSVVSISSLAGMRYIGKPQVAYAAAKAALLQFTRTTAVIYAPKGVRLNCVVPGLMDTPLVERLAKLYAGGDYEGFVAKRNAQVPMGRMGDGWDVAAAVAFLASDEARYITGTEIVVDGGLAARTP